MNVRNAPIGVMDSGVGGLTVVSEIWRQLPREEILFYGDSLRCPYGDRTPAEIERFTFRVLDYLVENGVKMLVIACNTATAICLTQAHKRYRVPVMGVIAPGARAAIAATSRLKVGVIGTKATIASGSYPAALHQTHRGIEVHSLACPSFVELVESGRSADADALEIVRETLAPLITSDMDTLILGCTHYPILSSQITQVVGPHVKLISSAEETARDVSHWLSEHHMTRTEPTAPKHTFFTSGDTNSFQMIARTWLKKDVIVHGMDVWDRGIGGEDQLAK